MTRLIAALFLIFAFAAGTAPQTAFAQAYPPNAMGVTMGHWHLTSRYVEANKKIFVALGGTPLKPGDFEIVQFPGVNVYLNQRAGTPPPTGGTVGTVINHVGFLVPNVQAAARDRRPEFAAVAIRTVTAGTTILEDFAPHGDVVLGKRGACRNAENNQSFHEIQSYPLARGRLHHNMNNA